MFILTTQSMLHLCDMLLPGLCNNNNDGARTLTYDGALAVESGAFVNSGHFCLCPFLHPSL